MVDQQTTSKASQQLISIKEVKDDVLILKDDSLRMVIMASSLNFALKSTEEQEAIILQYQNFLNSLDFHIQFFIQSRGLNIESYIDILKQKEQEQTDELLKIQTKEYIEFIREFVTATKIVTKSFYVVVPYTPTILETKKNPVSDFFTNIFKKKQDQTTTPQEEFEKRKIQLQQRADVVIQGLARVGIRSMPLETEGLIELFHSLYNPGETEKTSLVQTNKQQ